MSFFRRAGALIARFFTSAADPSAAAGEFKLYAKVDGGGDSQLCGAGPVIANRWFVVGKNL